MASSSLVSQLAPMLLDEAKHLPFSDPDWLFEIKYDGYRMLAEFGDGLVELRTRNGADCTRWFPEVARSLAACTGGPHVVDGEVCVLDIMGRSNFNRLQDRAKRRRWVEGGDSVTFCVFDVLVVGGQSVMHHALEDRKTMQPGVFTPAPADSILLVQAVPEQGKALFEYVLQLELEGLVAKRRGSIYRPGERTMDWRKLKRKGAVPPERFKRPNRPALF